MRKFEIRIVNEAEQMAEVFSLHWWGRKFLGRAPLHQIHIFIPKP